MRIRESRRNRARAGKEFDLTLDDFSKGVWSLTDRTRTPTDAAYSTTNLWQSQDRIWEVRPGTEFIGHVLESPTDGMFEAVKYEKGVRTTILLVIDNGKLKKSVDFGAWEVVAGKTWQVNNPVSMAQIGLKVYIANGVDTLSYYDIDTNTIKVYTALTVPNAPSIARTGLTAGSFKASYRISAENEVGETPAGNAAVITVNKKRDQWGANDSLKLTWQAVPNALRYSIYYADAEGYEVYLDSVDSTEYIDAGKSAVQEFRAAPIGDTTSGPILGFLWVNGARLVGCADKDNPQRVHFGGVGANRGAFNPFYGGGYVDIQLGGKYTPVAGIEYRTARGDSAMTVLVSDPEGVGATYQIELIQATIGTTTIIIPSPDKVTGSVGTDSPFALVEANDNLVFPGTEAFHSIGSAPNVANVLSSDDISHNIRPSVEGLTRKALPGAVGVSYRGRILFSVPSGSTINNQIWVLDLERNNWAVKWDMGLKRMIKYTDSAGTTRLLGLTYDENRLIAFNDDINTDYKGKIIKTEYSTGLIYANNNHIDYMHVDEVSLELGRVQGRIQISIVGELRNQPLKTIKRKELDQTTESTAGIGSQLFSGALFSEANKGTVNHREPNIIKTIRINRRLRNMYIVIESDTPVRYSILRINVRGKAKRTITPQKSLANMS